jgi:hypothetical protein
MKRGSAAIFPRSSSDRVGAGAANYRQSSRFEALANHEALAERTESD